MTSFGTVPGSAGDSREAVRDIDGISNPPPPTFTYETRVGCSDSPTTVMHPEFASPSSPPFLPFLPRRACPHTGAQAKLPPSIIAWLFATNIISAVDALMWGDSDAIIVVVWCDITAFATFFNFSGPDEASSDQDNYRL
ncbi:hypothetical protein K438DRAFT_1984577 [Mycena galopus ATCC 62051]|nr:hypothetical protein K438DRAFT_1984577 [Mycena galopus ATCC 62051]